MNRLFVRNDAKYRLARTIIQGILGVLIANIDVIVGGIDIPPTAKPIIVGLVMAILSPIMSALGTNEMDKHDVPDGYFEEVEDGDSNGDA